MSEYTPITGELRKYATVAWDPWPEARDRLFQMCDAIDSIHAQLERENESLKSELDRVLGEQEDRRSCIYYDPERHYCSCHDIDTDGWIELPRDADGKPIRIGDMMVGEKVGGGYCEPFGVTGYVMSNGVIEPMDEHKIPRMAKYAHHHAPDTWERIIEDALDGYHGTDFEKLVARCKALCERTKEEDA